MKRTNSILVGRALAKSEPVEYRSPDRRISIPWYREVLGPIAQRQRCTPAGIRTTAGGSSRAFGHSAAVRDGCLGAKGDSTIHALEPSAVL